MTEHTVAGAVGALFAQQQRGSILRLSDAIQRVRGMVRTCELTDDELGELISWHAVRAGVDLHFDRRSAA